MFGALRVARSRVQIILPNNILKALDKYVSSMNPRPSRIFIIAEACKEYLKNRGVPIPPMDDSDTEG